MPYIRRIVDAELATALAAVGAVLIEGPKACGKTETARRSAASELRVDTDPTVGPAMAVDPALLLEGPTPRLLDEWQAQPVLWNHVRRAVDDRGRAGQFILTGSATPGDDAHRHSGAGRFARVRMRPMSLLETDHSTGAVSLQALFDEATPRIKIGDLPLDSVIERVVTGGWPGLVGAKPEAAQRAVRDYLATVREVDVPRTTGARRDPGRLGRLIASVARNTATEASVVTLARDAGEDGDALARNTVDEYLSALRRLMILEDQPAWSTHLRSSATLRRSPKRHLADPSLAAAALDAGPARLRRDLETLGLLFESLVVRDLRVYAGAAGGSVCHYRDSYGVEVDAVVTLPDGRWGAIEVKLGAVRIDAAAASLLRFRDGLDLKRAGEPAFLAVATPSGLGYRRNDGVLVVPVHALGP